MPRVLLLRGGIASSVSAHAVEAFKIRSSCATQGALRSRTTLAPKAGPPIPAEILRKWYDV
jgi:hypothetical protein